MRIKQGFALWCALLAFCLIPAAGVAADEDNQTPQLTADEVIEKMLQMDQWRTMALQRYKASRRYVIDNKRFHKHAEVTVQEAYSYPGKKEILTVAESGSSFVRKKVIHKLIDAELESTRDENRNQTRITPEFYEFQWIGTDNISGRPCFLLEIIPKLRKKFLMRGEICVDQKDLAIVQIEGRPAKKPSFWTRKVHIIRRYRKHGPFWLTDSIESESDVWIAGKSYLKIDYFDYQINPPENPVQEVSEAIVAEGNPSRGLSTAPEGSLESGGRSAFRMNQDTPAQTQDPLPIPPQMTNSSERGGSL